MEHNLVDLIWKNRFIQSTFTMPITTVYPIKAHVRDHDHARSVFVFVIVRSFLCCIDDSDHGGRGGGRNGGRGRGSGGRDARYV